MSNTGEPAPDLTTPSTASTEDLLKDIKNERGEQKYLSVETALKALKDSQEYISKLKEDSNTERSKLVDEIERYQEELSQRETLEDLFERLSTKNPAEQPEPIINNEALPNMDNQQENLSELVKAELERIQAQNTASQNLQESLSSIEGVEGEEALAQWLDGKASEVGLTKDSLLSLAQSSPAAFKKLTGGTPQRAPMPTGSPSRVNLGEQPIDLTPETNMIYGATDAQRRAYAAKLREAAEKKYGVA